ncbi:siderophore ABC transporter substrate-binding protein [Virgibacillus xinjiangensis]|uniref:Siderophore ABC transporter substrate-binding protein n=1 Tax=Virgibacillus xinjiangensis TaxID=393090 RepID=A0ABV7CUY5_9BACI
MKKLLWLLSIMALFTLLAACGADSEGTNAEDAEDKETVNIEHELGETEVPVNPENVVVFDYGILDTLDHLDVNVAGVSKTSLPDYLSHYDSEEYENIGSLKEPDFEKIAEINPDVIIISARQASLYDQLSEIAPTVHLGVDTTRYMDSFKENMSKVGEIFGKKEEIDDTMTEIEDSIASLNEKTSDMEKEGLIILANDDKISAYGPNSRFGLIHDVFGVPASDEGIEASTHGMNVSPEYVMEQDPDLLYVVDRTAVVGGETSAKQIVENELTKNTKAYQNDQIYYLDPDYWYLSGGGLISVSEMIKEIEASIEQSEAE